MSSDFVVARARVTRRQRLSRSFVRITLGGDPLHEVGTPGRTFDQRIKLVLPGPSGEVPELPSDDWYGAWLALPDGERGSMRTYSVRHLHVDTGATRLVVDVVVHPGSGECGPGASWATAAAEGSEVLVVGPRRGTAGGGVEFAPGAAPSITLAGDETAAPAIARILEDLPRDARGAAFIEVPCPGDVLAIDAPSTFPVRWLPRVGLPHGSRLLPEVLHHVGVAAEPDRGADAGDDLVWETPTYSGLGEEVVAQAPAADRYYWIAGESGVVTALRRHLVRDAGVHRSQVAFMGYWRIGTAMRG